MFAPKAALVYLANVTIGLLSTSSLKLNTVKGKAETMSIANVNFLVANTTQLHDGIIRTMERFSVKIRTPACNFDEVAQKRYHVLFKNVMRLLKNIMRLLSYFVPSSLMPRPCHGTISLACP